MEIPATKTHGRSKATSSSSLTCPTCQASFKRPEHLKRHLRSHTKEKPFQCHHCSRRFSRSDTLHRHDQSHHAPGAQGKLDYAHRITVKTFRACYQCATARVRCSGGDPCARCQNRTIGCQYPTERRSKLKKANRVRHTSAEEDQSHGSAALELPKPNSGNDNTTPCRIRTPGSPRVQAPQQLQFQFVNHGDTHQHGVLDQHTFTPAQPTPTTDRTPEMGILSQQDGFEHSSKPSSMSYTYSNHDSQSVRHNDHSSLFTVADSISMSQDIHPTDPQQQESHMPITEQSMGMILDPHLTDPNPNSTLNWISTGLLKDHEDPLPVDTDLLNHSVEQWWPESFDTGIAWLSPLEGLDPMPLNNYFRQNVADPAPPLESPERYSSLSPDGSLLSSPVDDSVLSGEYYVDGDGPRCARNSRKRKKECPEFTEDIISSLQIPASSREGSTFSFPKLHLIRADNTNQTALGERQISPVMYEAITSSFDKLCRLESLIFTPFSTDHFPNPDTLTYLLRHYLDGFQPVYPIFHIPTFDPSETHWILVLAMSALGCNFANMPNVAQPLHEFVRRAIVVERQRSTSNHTPLWLMQSMLLNCIGHIYGGVPQSKDYGLTMFGELVHLAKSQGLLSTYQIFQDQDPKRRWRAWIESEAQKRTVFLIWLVDITLAYTTDHQPLLALRDIQSGLPVHESLWEANSEHAWQTLYKEENVSLCSAMEILFVEKRLAPGVGEFGHILLLHALYHRLWEVGDYFQRPLSWWTPTAEKRTRESALPSKSIWLPGIPLYSKWRNSVCDCLDTLHWSANATIAKASGIEHPTVLHLHTARLVLLVPFREIRRLARSLSRQEVHWDTLNQTAEWRSIWRWTRHDQYKARLSIVHAGSVIWHMRRYSTNAFHEPIAVFLATLTIWAYGLCNQSQTHSESPSSTHDVLASTANPSFIHVDRPCDDEIVQLFVRVGQSMRANISGVGDVCGSHGPTRILQEGIRMLSRLVSSWGAAHEYIDILSHMADQPSLATPAAIGEW